MSDRPIRGDEVKGVIEALRTERDELKRRVVELEAILRRSCDCNVGYPDEAHDPECASLSSSSTTEAGPCKHESVTYDDGVPYCDACHHYAPPTTEERDET